MPAKHVNQLPGAKRPRLNNFAIQHNAVQKPALVQVLSPGKFR